MTIIILLIPIIVAIILLCFFPKKVTWWEYCLLIIPSILFFFLIKSITIAIEEYDTEYCGNYVIKIRHYDEWNEYIHRICYRTVHTGKTSITVPYDCSYVANHPEKWSWFENDGSEIYLSYKDYYYLKNLWKQPQKIVDMHRHFYTKDGDAQDMYWDYKNELKCRPTSSSHTYINKINASKSIFKFEEISNKDAKKLKLFEYPPVNTNNETQQQVLGLKKKDVRGCHKIDYINGVLGKIYQFRMFILIFYNKDEEIATKQKAYWCGGNKNEFIVCLGVDSLNNEVKWCYPFSWQDTPILENKTKQYFINNPKLDLFKFGNFIQHNIKKSWKRKSFDDFKYLNIDLTQKQYMWLFLFIVIYNIGMSIYVVSNNYINEKNDRDNEDDERYYRIINNF